MYRAFLKVANKALPSKLHRQQYLHQRIRRQFEDFRGETDSVKRNDWERRAKNTFSLLETASERRGIERSIVRNLAEAEYVSTKFDKRSPFVHQKMKPGIRQLHDLADSDLQTVIDLLNKELDLCL